MIINQWINNQTTVIALTDRSPQSEAHAAAHVARGLLLTGNLRKFKFEFKSPACTSPKIAALSKNQLAFGSRQLVFTNSGTHLAEDVVDALAVGEEREVDLQPGISEPGIFAGRQNLVTFCTGLARTGI